MSGRDYDAAFHDHDAALIISGVWFDSSQCELDVFSVQYEKRVQCSSLDGCQAKFGARPVCMLVLQ